MPCDWLGAQVMVMEEAEVFSGHKAEGSAGVGEHWMQRAPCFKQNDQSR